MAKVDNNRIDFEILFSTMNRTSLSFLEDVFQNENISECNILIINQTSKNNLLKSDLENIRVINSFEKGLSKSRNLALQHAEGDICLIADDDITYKPGFKNSILSAFDKYQEADVITFQMVDNFGGLYCDYQDILIHNKKTLYTTVNSVVIALKRTSLLGNKVFYNEHFGLGGKFQTADEYVFLRNALKSNLNIYFEPKIILSHNYYSSGKAVASDRIIYALGALFYKYSGSLAYLRLYKYLYLMLKMKEIKVNEILTKYRVGLKGITAYQKLLKLGLEQF